MRECEVYIPAKEIDIATHEQFRLYMGLTNIAPGSGIVGQPWPVEPHDRIEIYFEGNLFDACNLREYEEMVLHAADRMFAKYPTMARSVVYPFEVVHVGWWNHDLRQLTVVDGEAEALLEEWKAQHYSKRGDGSTSWDEMMRYRWGIKT